MILTPQVKISSRAWVLPPTNRPSSASRYQLTQQSADFLESTLLRREKMKLATSSYGYGTVIGALILQSMMAAEGMLLLVLAYILC